MKLVPKPPKARSAPAQRFSLPLRVATLCPTSLLRIDLDNPRLQTGDDFNPSNEREVIEILSNIAALDELVLSICTNTYQNLEPLIVHGPDGGPFTVLEGNRRLAAVRLLADPKFADEIGVSVPASISAAVLRSIEKLLVYRVANKRDAREFIGFKHINGPQRWDAYAKAKYVTDWYKQANGALTVDDIADKMGDNNNTLRSYIYAILILEQAEASGVWRLSDRATARGRFAFSHLYIALQRDQYRQVLGLTHGWSNKPTTTPVARKHLPDLAEVLTYLYGSKSDARPSLIKSQNPDLKNLGLALADKRGRLALRSGAVLEEATDELKDPASAFLDALFAANLRLKRAIALMSPYGGDRSDIDDLVKEIFEQADTLVTMTAKKKQRARNS